MLGSSTFLQVYGVDPKRWALRWELEPFEAPCRLCGVTRTTTIPIARGKLRGLLAPRCACGNADAMYCVVHISGSLEAIFEE